jgi:hypothetical protein
MTKVRNDRSRSVGRRRIALAIAVTAVVSTACGDDGESAESPTSSAAEEATTSSSKPTTTKPPTTTSAEGVDEETTAESGTTCSLVDIPAAEKALGVTGLTIERNEELVLEAPAAGAEPSRSICDLESKEAVEVGDYLSKPKLSIVITVPSTSMAKFADMYDSVTVPGLSTAWVIPGDIDIGAAGGIEVAGVVAGQDVGARIIVQPGSQEVAVDLLADSVAKLP